MSFFSVVLVVLSICTSLVVPVKVNQKSTNSDDRYHYAVGNSDAEHFTVVNLDLITDEEIAEEVDAGVQEEFDAVDSLLGDALSHESLPEHRKERQRAMIYRGVYKPDSRFNSFVDGVMVNMVTDLNKRKMDPLYFKVHRKGILTHVPIKTKKETDSSAVPTVKENEDKKNNSKKGEAIGGGVIRGLSNIKRFGNAETQMAGNSTLVRSHHIFGPLEIEITFETESGTTVIKSGLSSLAAHALARVTPFTSEILDFIIDSPSEYEITLEGSSNKRFLRLSRSAILRLVKREGRMEKRLMRMFRRGAQRPLKNIGNKNIFEGKILWPKNGQNQTDSSVDEQNEKNDLKKYILADKKDFFPKKKLSKKEQKLKLLEKEKA